MASIRKTGTKTKIKNAFTELLMEKGLDNLTISDIARKADINRGTFYLHYVDKNDLLDNLEIDLLDNVQAIFEKHSEEIVNDPVDIVSYDAILEVLQYARVNIKLISALMDIGGNPNFKDLVKQLISDTIQKRVSLSENLSFRMGNLPHDYAQEILLSSIVSIIYLWIKKGALETPEEIANMITIAKTISPSELLL